VLPTAHCSVFSRATKERAGEGQYCVSWGGQRLYTRWLWMGAAHAGRYVAVCVERTAPELL